MAARAKPAYDWCGPGELVHSDDRAPGITRRRAGTGWALRGPDGGPVTVDDRARVRALVIPPAWTDVWICPVRCGHLQATGRDARGRKQYRYHPTFREGREADKFGALAEFGRALGPLRRIVDRDLRRPGLPEERVVALVVALLEETAVRIGNESYARENGSYGLTTLRNKHARWDHGALVLKFAGKSGKPHEVHLADRRLARAVRRCQDLPGQLLLQYEDRRTGQPHAVTSGDVNDYLRANTGIDATAKHFRTWIASVRAGELLAAEEPPTSQRQAASTLKDAIGVVAAELGNTVAVCRRSYVHPVVISAYEDGTLPGRWAAGPSRPAGGLEASERRLLALLEGGRRRRARPRAA